MRRLALALLLAAALVGCGGDDGAGDTAGGGGGAAAPAEPLSVEDALGANTDQPLLVEGALVELEGQGVYLCSALLESYPPQCGPPELRVEGLDLAAVDGLQEEGGRRWLDRPFRVLGTVEGAVLTVSSTAQ